MSFRVLFKKISCLLLLSLTSSAALALDDEGKEIRLVEALSGDMIYIHLKEPTSKKSSCSKYETIIACSTANNSFCSHALSIALAAQASNRTIDFQISEASCIGSAAEFTRLRMR
ncbi:hypothetical protein [Microbulbifer sp. DLAB2-AA]|uniref:hypothetical protein n=1 Tax=Microbulbifer sp. DLAB2-AA TaxID=3243394 RepID=UPI004039E7D8